jgi:4-amino-4-deoxy-L-arabinose transferase-like glycosyltransferase
MSREISSSSDSVRERTLFLGGLTLLLIAGAVFRLHELGLPAFDCDELYALRIQGSSLKEVASLVGRSAFHDLHPPLSYLLFMPWIALFGTAEAAVRSLPMLLGSVSIALIGFLGRRIGGVRAGLACAAFLAFSPFHIAYSQEARPYALAVTLTIAAHLFFLRSLGGPPAWNRIVYALLVVAAVYTHYFALLALLPHGLVALWLLRTGDEDSRRAARPTLLAFACGMAAFIAWLPALVFQVTGQSGAPSLGYLALGGSPLRRAGVFLSRVAGLGGPPFLLPALAALLVLVVFAFRSNRRLPAAPDPVGSRGLPPWWMGALGLLAGILLAAGLHLLAPRILLPPARQMLLAKGYAPDAVELELHGLQGFVLSIPLAMAAIGLLVLVWPGLSSRLDRLPRRISSGQGRPLAINVLLAILLLVPVTVTLVLALRGVPMLSDRNLLVCEAPLTLALGLGAVRLASARRGRLALVPVVLCLAFGRFQYQAVSGIFGVDGKLLGMQTGAWRDLARGLHRRKGSGLPLVVVDAPPSDPAEFYLRAHLLKRVKEPGPALSGTLVPAGLPGAFRFVHLQGDRSSEALLSALSRGMALQPRFQVDEFVVYDARPRQGALP